MFGLPDFDVKQIQQDVAEFKTELKTMRELLERLVAIEEGRG